MAADGRSNTLYTALGTTQSASTDEIRRCWRSLVLLYHPDKNSSSLSTQSNKETETAEQLLIVNRAWEVLREPSSREAYDRSLLHRAPSSNSTDVDRRTRQQPPPPLARTVLSLDLFTPHYTPHSSASSPLDPLADDAEDGDEPTHYTHPCRCSALFKITTAELEEGVEVIGCEGCGDWIRVGYEVLEHDESEDE